MKARSPTTHTVGYAGVCAASLVRYADTHISFARWLDGLISSHELPAVRETLLVETYPGLRPRTDDHAARRALWLLDAIAHKRLSGTDAATAVLALWQAAREHEHPKAVVLGIKYGVLPIGILGHPKLRREPMSVVVRDDVLRTQHASRMARTLTTLTHGVVEQGLVLAGGRTAKLEPELGDWLFGDKSLALYQATSRSLATLTAAVARTGAPHVHRKDAYGIAMLACTPMIDLTDIPGSETLRSIEG